MATSALVKHLFSFCDELEYKSSVPVCLLSVLRSFWVSANIQLLDVRREVANKFLTESVFCQARDTQRSVCHLQTKKYALPLTEYAPIQQFNMRTVSYPFYGTRWTAHGVPYTP